MSSAPFSPTSKKAVPSEPVEYAFADEEQAVELHRFLCVFATHHPGVLKAPIDAEDSVRGVLEVLHDGFAATARIDGHIVGSIGIITVPWWYNRSVRFMTDRWFFVYPKLHHRGIGSRLQAEAQAIATQAGMKLILQGHAKERGNGIDYTMPALFEPGVKKGTH